MVLNSASVDSVILIAVSPLRDFLWTSTTCGLSAGPFYRFVVCRGMHKHRRHDFSTEKRTGVDAKGSGSSLIPYTCTLQRCSVPLRVQLGIHVFEKCADHRQCDSDTCMISSPHMHVDFAAVSPGAYFDKSHKRFAPLYPSPTWWMTLRPLTCRIADKDSDCGDVERDGGKSVDEQPSPSNDQALSSNPTPTSPPRNRPQLSGMVAASTRPFCRCNKIGELSFCQRRH